MSTVNSQLSGQYYKLPEQSSSQTRAKTQNPALTELLSAVAPGQTTKANNAGNQSYLLNLSDAAKSYLSGLQQPAATSSVKNSDSFILNSKQRDTLNKIIDSYKDKPVTQENYNALQKELDEAGLSPKRLAIRDQLRNLNPTALFLDALSGRDTSASQPQKFGELTDEQKNQADNYLSSIVKQWQQTAPAPAETPTQA